MGKAVDLVELACKPESTRRSDTEGSFLIPPPPPPRRQRVPVPAPSAAAPRCASLAAASPPAGDGHDKPRPLFPPPKFPFLSLSLRKVSVLPSAGTGVSDPPGRTWIDISVCWVNKFWGSAKPTIRA